MDEDDLEDNPRIAGDISDNEGESEAVDYRFLAAVNKKDCSIPARGEKDFEPDGTNKQSRILDASRAAMYTALSVERDLVPKSYIRATWLPDSGFGRLPSSETRGTMFISIGRADNNGITWLQPEELLFMIERGNIECFYENIDVGMSLQSAYAELIPYIGVDEFQVYAYLKRAGFMVLRARQARNVLSTAKASALGTLYSQVSSVCRRLQRVLVGKHSETKGTLDQHHIYRSYEDVYSRLSLVPCHRFEGGLSRPYKHDNPLKLSFDVWKPNTHFRKSAPGPPDFRMAVLNSRDYDLFSIDQIAALFDTLEPDESYSTRSQFERLKVGKRHFILAIADMGVISFMTFGDVSFGSEHVYTPWQPSVVRKHPPRTKHIKQ